MNPTTAASIPRPGATPRQTGELYGEEYRAAVKMRDAADRVRAEYENTYRLYELEGQGSASRCR